MRKASFYTVHHVAEITGRVDRMLREGFTSLIYNGSEDFLIVKARILNICRTSQRVIKSVDQKHLRLSNYSCWHTSKCA